MLKVYLAPVADLTYKDRWVIVICVQTPHLCPAEKMLHLHTKCNTVKWHVVKTVHSYTLLWGMYTRGNAVHRVTLGCSRKYWAADVVENSGVENDWHIKGMHALMIKLLNRADILWWSSYHRCRHTAMIKLSNGADVLWWSSYHRGRHTAMIKLSNGADVHVLWWSSGHRGRHTAMIKLSNGADVLWWSSGHRGRYAATIKLSQSQQQLQIRALETACL